MGVTAPPTASTTDASMTQLEMGTCVPPLTVGIHVSTSIHISPHPKVRARLDDRLEMGTCVPPLTAGSHAKPF